MSATQARLRQLPSIDRLLSDPTTRDLLDQYGREAVKEAFRYVLEVARTFIQQGGLPPTISTLFEKATDVLRREYTSSLRPVINATGVILQTNLGRAPLSRAAQELILQVAAGYSTLEYDLDAGTRGKRDTHIEALVMAITGAEAALVVNNNAAAVVLILGALAFGREVIISRGQLVEIGGGFRVPDVMVKSGAKLVEVGTTNRTHVADFAEAITPNTALLMRAHASNFKQIGFVEQPALAELAELAHAHGFYAVDDLGSGAVYDTAEYGLAHEPTVQESLQAGFDLVAFSGDKLLGGPQAGIICGKADLIAKLKRHPLARAMRIDKLSLAGLVATLQHYRMGTAASRVPVVRMLAMSVIECRQRVESWVNVIGSAFDCEILETQSAVGGGSLPGETLPTVALALRHPNLDALAQTLRVGPTPVVARVADGRIWFDPRTILPDQDSALLDAIQWAWEHLTPPIVDMADEAHSGDVDRDADGIDVSAENLHDDPNDAPTTEHDSPTANAAESAADAAMDSAIDSIEPDETELDETSETEREITDYES